MPELILVYNYRLTIICRYTVYTVHVGVWNYLLTQGAPGCRGATFVFFFTPIRMVPDGNHHGRKEGQEGIEVTRGGHTTVQ